MRKGERGGMDRQWRQTQNKKRYKGRKEEGEERETTKELYVEGGGMRKRMVRLKEEECRAWKKRYSFQ